MKLTKTKEKNIQYALIPNSINSFLAIELNAISNEIDNPDHNILFSIEIIG
jgi:hypothetical protein